MALLLLDRVRERWKDFVDELSKYYNTPGRLVVFRRQFENAHRRPGLDPATFATELGNKVATCAGIWIVLRRRRRLWTS